MRAPVAIIGVGGVLPGASDVPGFWTNLLACRSAVRAPAGELCFDPTQYVGEITIGGRVPPPYFGRAQLAAGWVTDQWTFDWRRYRIPPADAAAVNRMQWVTLEAGSQALGGVQRLPRDRTAIVIGASGLGFQKDVGLRVRRADMLDALRATAGWQRLDEATRARVLTAAARGFDARVKECSSDDTVGVLGSVAAARIAMHHDLYGPHYAVDADHGSALAALEVAIAGLDDGEWDCALAGGVSELLTPVELAAYAAAGLLSPSGRARPFADDADGLVLGEGAALFALKRLDDALRDGDTVYALVRGIGRAARTPTLTAAPAMPDAAVIAEAMTRAWTAAASAGGLR